MSTIGDISQIYNNATPSTVPSSTGSTDYKSQFLKLLMVQLRNQDPTQPFDSQQMLAQQAEFASLEQMQNLNTNLITLMAMQNVTQATTLIGKTVQGRDAGGADVTGTVSGIGFSEGSPVLRVTLADLSVITIRLPDVVEITN